MKGRIRKSLAAMVVVAGLIGAGIGVAVADSHDAIVQGTTNSSVYKAGRTVNITGTVNGDVFCFGQDITIDATVNGDVICAGQTVHVNGAVHGNVRLAGQTVGLGAKVDKNASVAGQDVTIQSNASVGSDLSVATQTLDLEGSVGRDVHASGNTVSLNGKVGRNVLANANKVDLQPGATIKGNLDYTSPQTVRQNGGDVVGITTYHPSHERKHGAAAWHSFALAFRLYWGLALLVSALLLAAIFPQLFHRWNKLAVARPGASLLTGLVAMFAVPALMIALFASVLGVPLALLVLLGWLALILLSAPVAAYWVGSMVFRQARRSPVLVMLVGAAVLFLVTLVPVIGGLLTLLAYWFGAGAVLLNLRKLYKKPNYKTT